MSQPRDTNTYESTSSDFSPADLVVADAEMPATMCEAFQPTVAQRGDAIALRTVGGGASYTRNEYAEKAAAIAGGRAARGVRPGDPIALLLANRPEFHFAGTAMQHQSATPFSCYNSSSPEQLGYLLRASGVRVAITERRLAAGTGPDNPLDLVILVDGPTAELGEGEDGGGSHSPPPDAETFTGAGAASDDDAVIDTGTGEDGGGSHTPPEEVGTGEDGGGSHEPPKTAETDTGTGEDGGGSHEPPKTADTAGAGEHQYR